MSRFIKAEQGPGNSVIYTSDDGHRCRRSGGDWAWRNNNPGNLVPGKVSKRNGAIGAAGGFAVFPDHESGHNALLDSLRSIHGKQSIPELMRDYAPEPENDTKGYIKWIRKRTGVNDNRKIKDFTENQFESLWQAIEKMEGGKKGKVDEVKSEPDKAQITGVRKNKRGIITGYCIEGMGWVSKAQGVQLTLDGKVDAVVATSPRGNTYLHARRGNIPLDSLG